MRAVIFIRMPHGGTHARLVMALWRDLFERDTVFLCMRSFLLLFVGRPATDRGMVVFCSRFCFFGACMFEGVAYFVLFFVCVLGGVVHLVSVHVRTSFVHDDVRVRCLWCH